MFGLKVAKSDRELLSRLREGDQVAFYMIYERYCKRLYRFVFRYIKQDADAEELVQEVFVKVWEAREKINLRSSFESFLFTVAYNATITLFRKRVSEKKYVKYLKSVQQPGQAPEVISEIQFKELNGRVQALLDELTPRQKEIFLLSREEKLTHEEIAGKLNISVNTVKKHITSTLSFLRSNLDGGLIVHALYISLFL